MIIPVTLLATRETINVNLAFVYPPIPVRDLDWAASDDDGDETSSVGSGRTMSDAMTNLLEQLEEAAPSRCLCAWCGITLRNGVLPASHGICQLCKFEFESDNPDLIITQKAGL